MYILALSMCVRSFSNCDVFKGRVVRAPPSGRFCDPGLCCCFSKVCQQYSDKIPLILYRGIQYISTAAETMAVDQNRYIK